MKNKYYKLLEKIILKGKLQQAKKNNSICLLNEKLSFSEKQIVNLFNQHKVAKAKLATELELYMGGITDVKIYNDNNINWWDYCNPSLINSYPTYFKDLQFLINKINTLKPSKNYVFFIGNTTAYTNQLPCLSLMQFQIQKNKLYITVYQRSADSNLGLPSDIYQVYLISKLINLKLANITFFIGNAHIYENNIEETKKCLNGLDFKFNLNT
jgi:thymidylate synthase